MNCISVGRNIVFPVVYCITGKSEHRISSVRNIGFPVVEILCFRWLEYCVSVGRNIEFPGSESCIYGGWNIAFPVVPVVGIFDFRWSE